MSNNGTVVAVDKLTKYFKSGGTTVPAVDDVSFELPRGKMIAIKGASGSGKSTLLNLLGALDRPTSGTIIVDGVDVSRIHGGGEVRYRLSTVGFVFQSYYLIPNLTALENVMLPMELNGTKRNGPRGQGARAAQAGGHRRLPPGPPPHPAFRRRAAAGGHRPGPGQQPLHHPGR